MTTSRALPLRESIFRYREILDQEESQGPRERLSLVHLRSSCGQRTRPFGRFNDDHGAGETGNDSIAAWKSVGLEASSPSAFRR